MMRHKLLGRSGLRVSELCLGTLTFGEGKDWGADAKAATAILGAFADRGGTFIDTAPNYSDGAAEEIVGKFVAGSRDDFTIATKFTASGNRHPLAGGNSRKSMVRAIDGSLRRLGSDYVDVLRLHYWDGTAPLDEIMRAFDDLVTAGKVLYLGMSDTPAWLISRAATLADLRGWAPVIATQLEYNVAARGAEHDLLPMADALDLGVVAWGPLAAGALAGSNAPRRRAAAALPDALAHVAAAVGRIADETGLSPLSLALGWAMRRSRCIPIVGARTADQIKTTMAASGAKLDPSVLDQLDALARPASSFPQSLIGSAYLRRLALGDPAQIDPPIRERC